MIFDRFMWHGDNDHYDTIELATSEFCRRAGRLRITVNCEFLGHHQANRIVALSQFSNPPSLIFTVSEFYRMK